MQRFCLVLLQIWLIMFGIVICGVASFGCLTILPLLRKEETWNSSGALMSVQKKFSLCREDLGGAPFLNLI